MKINNIENLDGLFEVINQCKGTVELVSKEGDRLNLKSTLTQYLTLAKIFSHNEVIDELELIAHDPEDTARIFFFILNGKCQNGK